MKWVSHLAIAGAICAAVNPVLVPAALVGATAPDWMEGVVGLFGVKIKHRTTTHYFLIWSVAVLFFLFLWDFQHVFLAFALGGLLHVVCDAITIMGVPFSPHSDRKFHLFGGRLRTGGVGEYGITGAVVVACFVFVLVIKPRVVDENRWYPFFYNWGKLYSQGTVDAKEWKENRLKFF